MRGIMPGSLGPFPLSWVTGTSTTLVHLSRRDGVYHTLNAHPLRCLRFPGGDGSQDSRQLDGFWGGCEVRVERLAEESVRPAADQFDSNCNSGLSAPVPARRMTT